MKVLQLVTTLNYGDAVGNDVCAIKSALVEAGYETEIYAESIGNRVPVGMAKSIAEMPILSNEDILIYHLSIGTRLNYDVAQMIGKKILVYHNVTPPHYFSMYSPALVMATYEGIRGARYLADKVDYCIADSEYNKTQLLEMNYQCPIEVCPILIPFSDYQKTPDEKVIDRYCNDGYVNLLFVGRIAPNKRQENVIRAFYYYHKHYNPKSRLFLVGNWSGMETYYERLVKYVDLLDLSGYVVFPGHIRFEEILAYYHLADIFVCMSEHEGFCVPLVEAMYFNIPIIAYNTSAIGYTLDGCGLLLDDSSPEYVSAVINRVIEDTRLKECVLEEQQKRLMYFQPENAKKQFLSILDRIVHCKPQETRLDRTKEDGHL